jgi:hypothetical protein
MTHINQLGIEDYKTCQFKCHFAIKVYLQTADTNHKILDFCDTLNYTQTSINTVLLYSVAAREE